MRRGAFWESTVTRNEDLARLSRTGCAFCLGALLCIPLLAWSSAGLAQQAADTIAEADTALERGDRLFEQGRFREALAVFVGAEQSEPSVEVRLRIARTYRELGDYAKAHVMTRQLLAARADELDEEKRAELERAHRELARLTGTIQISVGEPGASVRVDGKLVGTTPLGEPLIVGLGTHHIEVVKAGTGSLEQKVVIEPAAVVRVTGPLVAAEVRGELAVTLDGEGPAELVLDGRTMGPLPWKGAVPEGEHEIAAIGDTVRSDPVRVTVVGGRVTRTVLVPAPRSATLTLRSSAPQATLRVDGGLVGGPNWTGELPAGAHEIVVTRPGFLPYRERVVLSARETLVVHLVQWQPDPSAEEEEPNDAYTPVDGLYVRLSLLGLFGTGARHQIARECPPAAVNGTCSSTAPAGGGADVRVGHAFLSGLVSPELFALGSVDASWATVYFPEQVRPEDSAYYGVPRREDYVFWRYGGGGGLAVRTTTTTGTVRFTGALGFGALLRAVGYGYAATTYGSTIPDAAERVTEAHLALRPILVADGGVTIGHTMGAKLYGGVLMTVEFSGSTTDRGTNLALGYSFDPYTLSAFRQPLGVPPLELTHGAEFFIGPILGLRFGS